MANASIKIVQSALLMLSLTLITSASTFARGNFSNAGGFGYNNGYNNNVQPGNVWQGGRNNIYKNNNGLRPNYQKNFNNYNNNFNNNYNNNYNNNPYRNYRNYNNQGYPYNNNYYNGVGGSNNGDDYINAGPADNANCPLIQVCGATGCLLTPSC